MIKPQHSPRFDIDTQRGEFLSYLEEYGYAVVANVADAQAVEKGKNLLWDFLQNLEGNEIRHDDVATWEDNWLPSPQNGILAGFGFGQCDFMWHLRLLPKIKSAFAAIWETDDLIVSFDGGNMFRPWKYNPSWLTTGGWFHVDQNHYRPHRQGKVCVQGLVTLLDADETTGGLVVIPGSHRHHKEVCDRCPQAKGIGDFIPLEKSDPLLADGSVLVCAKAGDLIVWDSRTVHCNTPALTAETDIANNVKSEADSSGTKWELIRQVGYVCMTPASFATQEVLDSRKMSFQDGHSNSHWPHACVISGAGIPGVSGIDPESASKEQRDLVGYRDETRPIRCVIQ
mmetsp:Transcript_5027/g.6388  ORF Transcript_5027/g.6388 Transcript_5027/m.6388 type:complete len:341 (-) Transcript_5027:328-1350(-)|eukprot:CAMPEP_0114342298 /NCGR_PEP_ID=MMETSP0101-20121206/9691_1 /TAXON_ID=38822 ORGANISM="Pteridomonas danica, Strain PT" /NCGR_SAMPLE_ID=MMETSP0101 /ASSEMBLY_ACC=CAM_ASM_000211 /LENGTH=340 /DNA_ID=CAMNT_0001476329 /DNA_START=40 /DNA_END=1062 /DNA_ORIENTATION=+